MRSDLNRSHRISVSFCVGVRQCLARAALCLLAGFATGASATPKPTDRPSEQPSAAKLSLSVCISDTAIPPHSYPDRDGLAQILFRRVAEAQGILIHYIPVPTRRCLSDISRGDSKATPLLGYSTAFKEQFAYPQREGQVDVRRSSGTTELVFVTRKGSSVRWDGKQLTGNKAPVLLRPGTPASETWLASQGIPFQSSAATIKQIGQMLVADRADVMLLHKLEAEVLHQQPEIAGQLQTLAPSAATVHGYAVFNRDFAAANPALVEAIWNDIGRIRASAEWKAFAEKFERDVLQGVEPRPSNSPAH